MEKPAPVSKAKTDACTQSQSKRRPVGFRQLPWHIVENILLQKALSYPDVVSFIEAYAPNHHAVNQIIASTGRFRMLWQRKFKQSYPDLYRLLRGSGIAGHETFTWYHLLKKRWDTGQSVARSLKAFRVKNMEETIAVLQNQADNLAYWFTDIQAGDLNSIQTQVETVISSTPQVRGQQERKTTAVVFVGNGRLAQHDFHSKLQFLFYNRALANMILGDNADCFDNVPHPVPNEEVPLLTKLMVVDACRDHAQNNRLEDGPAYDMINTMKMCQTAVGYYQIFLYTEHLTEMMSGALPKKGVPEDFFALVNYLQACYPHCTDVLVKFYHNAFDSKSMTFDYTKRSMGQINALLQKLGASLLADDLAFACGFASNFPYISLKSDNLPPIVTFLYVADKFLSNEFVTVTLQKVTLGITVKNAENVWTNWDDIYMLLPCVRVDGIDHYCIPNRRSRHPEIFTDNAKLATALHRRLFSQTYEHFGTVYEVKIISVTTGSLMDHFRSYMKYLTNADDSARSRTFQSIYSQSKSHGGSLVPQFCQLFTNIDLIDLMQHFLLFHKWTKAKRDQGEENDNHSSVIDERSSVLPVGTVVRIKYRNFTPGYAVDGPEHFAVIVSWNIQQCSSTSESGQTLRVTCYCVCLDTSHPNDPYYPDTCARIAETMTVVDELPEAVQVKMGKNPVLHVEVVRGV